MPILDQYVSEVTVSVRLRAGLRKEVVAEYSVTRTSEGPSATVGSNTAANNLVNVVESGLVQAVAAEKALRAGLANAEARRLK